MTRRNATAHARVFVARYGDQAESWASAHYEVARSVDREYRAQVLAEVRRIMAEQPEERA